MKGILFADNAALIAHTEVALQRLTSCFLEALMLFCLEVSLRKSEVLHHSVPRDEH